MVLLSQEESIFERVSTVISLVFIIFFVFVVGGGVDVSNGVFCLCIWRGYVTANLKKKMKRKQVSCRSIRPRW